MEDTSIICLSKEQLLALVYEFDQSHASTIRAFIDKAEALSRELDQKASEVSV